MQNRIIKEAKQTPGSDEAVAIGCKCPRMDNEYGRGCGGQFVVRMDCPVHSMEVEALQVLLGIKDERNKSKRKK